MRLLRFCSALCICVFSLLGFNATPMATAEPSLIPGLDTYSKPITTESDAAQQWFDQGLLLLYGFNHDEATRSFRQAATLDPEAAMPWWGIACIPPATSGPFQA